MQVQSWIRRSPWRRAWQCTPVFMPGESHGQRSLVGCSPWGCEELDTTERPPFHFSFHALEKEMATHSSVLAWRIPGTGQPRGLLSMGSHTVRHDLKRLSSSSSSNNLSVKTKFPELLKRSLLEDKKIPLFLSSFSLPLLLNFPLCILSLCPQPISLLCRRNPG